MKFNSTLQTEQGLSLPSQATHSSKPNKQVVATSQETNALFGLLTTAGNAIK